jgi:hypothetical protein
MCRRSGPDRGTSLRTPRCVPRMTGSDDQRPTTNGTLAQPVQKRSGTEASHLDPTIRQVVLVAKAEPEGSAGNRDRSTSARRHVRTARAKHRREARCKAPGRTSPRGLPFRLLRMRRCLRSGGVPGYRSSLRASASDVAQQARFGVGGSRRRSKLRLDYTADLASRKHDGNRFPSVPCIAAACATATLRRRGLSSQDSRHRCRYPAPALGRLRPELLPDVPPAFDSPIAGRSDRGGSRYLSLPLVPSCGLRRRMCGCGSGPSRPVTSSQIIFAPTHLHARHSRWL